MAKIYLASTDSNFLVSNNNTTIVGTSGTAENVLIASGVTGTTVDSTVEQVDLAGAMSAYTFKQGFGSNMEVYSGTTLVMSLTDVAGKTLSFSNGTVALTYAGTTVSVGGTALTSTAAAVTPVTIDATNVSSATSSTTTTTTTTPSSSLVSTTAIDVLTGTSGNDTFVADAATASNADQINGGEGTDTYKLYGGAGIADIPTLTSMEVVELIGNTVSTDLSGVTSMTTLILDDATTTNAYTIGATVAATIKTMVNGESITLTSTATDTTADLTVSAMDAAAAGTVTVNADGAAISTVNIASTGATANSITLASTGNEATVNVTGATALTLAALAATATTLNASAMTAALTATMGVTTTATSITTGSAGDTINAATAAVDYTINLGAGNDYVAMANLTVADSVVGGDGTDTIGLASADAEALDGGSAAEVAILAKVTGFEQVRITNALAGTLDLGTLGYNYVQVTTALGADRTITGVRTGFTLESRLDAAAANDYIITMTGATGAGTSSDTINLNLNADLATNDQMNAISLDLAGINIVNISANDRNTTTNPDTDADGEEGYTVDLAGNTAANSANITTVNVTGAQQVAYTVNAATVALATYNASAATGEQEFTGTAFAGTQGLTITTGTGADTIIGSTLADVINGGAGNDSITGLAGLDTLTGGAGVDTFTFANAATGLPSATAFDTITDFAKGSDIIDGPGALTIGLSGTASSGTAAINAEGIASFNVADSTLALKLTAVAAGVEIATATTANDIAIFEHDGASYLFITDGTAGLSATDVLIKLSGVTGLTDSTITAGDLVIA